MSLLIAVAGYEYLEFIPLPKTAVLFAPGTLNSQVIHSKHRHEYKQTLRPKGGLLADEMGLG